MKHILSLYSNNGQVSYTDSQITLKCTAKCENTRFGATVSLTEWENDAYVFLPACVYDGNRMKKSFCSYPPTYNVCELGDNPDPIISDIPAFSTKDEEIQVTSGDMSVPCVGVFYKEKKQALFIFCKQECKGKNIGFSVKPRLIEIQFPAARTKEYRMCKTDVPSADTGFNSEEGEVVCVPLLIKDFSCASITEFFEYFFNNRKILCSSPSPRADYSDRLWSIMESHMNKDNYSGEYYAEMNKKWQCGWVGGGMSSLPLLKHGCELSRKRALQTLDFMTSHIAPTGFFYPMIEEGEIKDDGFGKSHLKSAMLTRKVGDGLYFLFKHFDVASPKEQWVDAARRCADAFTKLYAKYGSFGQFVNVETGEMLFGGTTSGASVISALVRAYSFFGDEKYLTTSASSCEGYYRDFVARGITYGGPGEALCAPDSESSYAMVESCVLLYEATGDEKWLSYAKDSLHLFSSWVMTYAYRFPAGSEFARLNINTVGSVFANAQNKHSAPGICTSSGDAIYKLYKYTKNEKYLELLRDIVSFIPQCVSTVERPIFSWDVTPRQLDSGWICERVNTSDWEGQRGLGGVFYGSCWCETSLLLTFSEITWNDEISTALKLK